MNKLFHRFLILLLLMTFIFTSLLPGTGSASINWGTKSFDVSPYKFVAFAPGGAPAAFNNVTYRTKSNVVRVNGKLGGILKNARIAEEMTSGATASNILPQEKLNMNAFVSKAQFAAQVPGYSKGMVILDETSGLAARVSNIFSATGSIQEDSIMLSKPQLSDVLEDYTIPQQTVVLNRSNISAMPDAVRESIITRGGSRYMQASAGSGASYRQTSAGSGASNRQTLAGSGTSYNQASAGNVTSYLNPAITSATGINLFSSNFPQIIKLSDNNYGSHLKNPFIELEFKDKILAAYSSDGESVLIKVSGYLGLDSISVDGKYSFSGGYRFVASMGEEVHLKVQSAINMKKELVIPLFAIDVPAGFAHAQGGIYLVVGMDGNFTLVTEASQWLTAKAGISGGTFLGVPTSFNPIFSCDKGFDADMTFFGSINGYIKAGPLLNLSLLGWDVAGAGLLGGAGLTCTADDEMISANIYGSLELYATLVGERINLLNSRFTLFDLKIPNTKGYDIKFYEADAYRRAIWGKIQKDYGAGGIKPYSGELEIALIRGGQIIDKFITRSDINGEFSVLNISTDMYKGDKIKVVRVDNTGLNSAAIEPSIPFRQLNVEYADFFSDKIKGQVSPVRVKNWSTGKFEMIYYNGDVTCNLTNASLMNIISSVELPPVKCTGEGFYEFGYDFKPEQMVGAKITFNGFTYEVKQKVKTTAVLLGERIIQDLGTSEYQDNGKLVQKNNSMESFVVHNLRGTKNVDAQGSYNAKYYYYDFLSSVCDPVTGKQFPPQIIGDKVFNQYIYPEGPGCSLSNRMFVLEWVWAPGSGTRSIKLDQGLLNGIWPIFVSALMPKSASGNAVLIPKSASGNAVLIPKSASGAAALIPRINPNNHTPDINNMLKAEIAARIKLNPNDKPYTFRYDSGIAKEDADGTHVKGFVGTGAIRKKGVLTINYEGAAIEIKDPNDTDKNKGGKHVLYQVDPYTRLLNDMYWSRINPEVILPNYDELISKNSLQAATWSKNSLITALNKGFLNVDSQGKLTGSKNVTRGEFASYITRALNLKPSFTSMGFTDIPAMYPYAYEINTAVRYGIMSGSNGRFDPYGTVTREDAAVFVMNGLKKLYSRKLSIPTLSSRTTFSDIRNVNSRNITAVRELSALNLMYRQPSGAFMPKSTMTLNDTAVLLDNVNKLSARMK